MPADSCVLQWKKRRSPLGEFFLNVCLISVSDTVSDA